MLNPFNIIPVQDSDYTLNITLDSIIHLYPMFTNILQLHKIRKLINMLTCLENANIKFPEINAKDWKARRILFILY